MSDIDTSVLEEGLREREQEPMYVDEEVPEYDEEELMTHLDTGIVLIRRAKTLIDYLADPNLCKVVSKKERSTMVKLSDRMKEYVSSVEATFGDFEGGINDLSI